MITCSKFYLFGGKVTTVETPAFNCMISTAKDGLFKKQSVVFVDFSSGMENHRPVAKIRYNDALDKKTRLRLHDAIAHSIDESGMNGENLGLALSSLFQRLQREGIAVGLISNDPLSAAERKPELSPIEKVVGGMEIFSECALAVVQPSIYRNNPRKRQAVFAYLFGACDALGQMHGIEADATVECYRSLLERSFPSMSANDVEDVICFVKAATRDEAYAGFVQAGGESVVEWSRKNPEAPLRLKRILSALDVQDN